LNLTDWIFSPPGAKELEGKKRAGLTKSVTLWGALGPKRKDGLSRILTLTEVKEKKTTKTEKGSNKGMQTPPAWNGSKQGETGEMQRGIGKRKKGKSQNRKFGGGGRAVEEKRGIKKGCLRKARVWQVG